MTMMPKITLKNTTPNDFDEAYPLLQNFTNARLTRDDWRALFVPAFPTSSDHLGYLLRDQGKAVGVMGCIFSQRTIRGHQFEFCNLSSWFIHPDYRKYSMLFMRRLAELDSCVLTSLTPCKKVHNLFIRMGFVPMEERLLAIPPIPFGSLSEPPVHLVSDPLELRIKLKGEALDILNDHSGLDCRHFLAESQGETCYIVCTKRYKRSPGLRFRRIPTAVIHHASNPGLLARALHTITRRICLRMRAALVISDSRFIGLPSVPFSLSKPASRLYRPCKDQPFAFAPHEVDNLYSEFMLLNF